MLHLVWTNGCFDKSSRRLVPAMKSDAHVAAQVANFRNAPRRLLLGALIMAISGLVGARLFQTQNASVTAWQLQRDVAAGRPVAAADLQSVRLPITLAEAGWLQPNDLTPGTMAAHPLRRGQLLYLSDVSTLAAKEPTVSVRLGRGRVPSEVHAGQTVELWSAAPEGAFKVSESATVISITPDQTDRSAQLTMEVQVLDLPGVLAAAAGDTLAVVTH